MKRHAQPHIVLPRLDAREASVLGESLVRALERESAPDLLIGPAAKLRGALASLEACARRKLAAPPRPKVRAAQLAEGAAWGALHGLVAAWSRLPLEAGVEEAGAARDIERSIFTGGLPFLHMPAIDRWVETHLRLEHIDRNLGPAIDRIGGRPILDHLRRTHAVVGEVLGITKRRPPAVEGPNTKECLKAVQDALRRYLLSVITLGDEDEPSRALAERLLAPIEGWKGKPRRRGTRARSAEAAALPHGIDVERGDLEPAADHGSAAPAEAPALPQGLDMERGDLEPGADHGSAGPMEAPALRHDEIVRGREAPALPQVEITPVAEAPARAGSGIVALGEAPALRRVLAMDFARLRARRRAPIHAIREPIVDDDRGAFGVLAIQSSSMNPPPPSTPKEPRDAS